MQAWLSQLQQGWAVGLALLLLALAASSSFRAVADSLAQAPADTWLLRWALTASPRWRPLAVFLNRWADTSVSWKNKYRPGTENSTLVPRFPGATTWLVWVTDLWHFANFLQLLCWQVLLVVPQPLPLAGLPWYYKLAALALLKAWAGLCFEGFYRLLRISK